MEFRAKEIKEKSKNNYEEVWLDTAKLLQEKGRSTFWLKGAGKKHPVIETELKFRKIFLNLGFDEVILPSIIPDTEVYKQYGPEAPIILDRVYYLGGLNRNELGISGEKERTIFEIIPNFKYMDRLKEIFRDYKKGTVEADDFIEEMVNRLKIRESQAAWIIDRVFPEFKQLKPSSTNLTLRSHMTASWFPALAKLQRKSKLPVKLFSIGNRYRREQKQDENHLFVSTSASIVVMSKNITLEDGHDLTKKILEEFGFAKTKIIAKKTTSKYYAPGMDFEVYMNFKGKDLEVANLGLYSPVSLASYKIWYPVLNLGFGVERMAMILGGVGDIRSLVHGEVA